MESAARVLIRDGYACAHRDATGRRCNANAGRVAAMSAPGNRSQQRAVCALHLSNYPRPVADTAPPA